jgi:hypothetical protein
MRSTTTWHGAKRHVEFLDAAINQMQANWRHWPIIERLAIAGRKLPV